jgi:hypothetical protein
VEHSVALAGDFLNALDPLFPAGVGRWLSDLFIGKVEA